MDATDPKHAAQAAPVEAAMALEGEPGSGEARTRAYTVLHGTDFSPCSDAALRWAAALAKARHGRLTVVHVFQPPVFLAWAGGSALAPAHVAYLEDLRSQAHDQLEARCRGISEVKAEPLLADGQPHRVLVELSKRVDLLVLGTHGRTGLSRALIGSVAAHVVRMAHCPVLTVPPGG